MDYAQLSDFEINNRVSTIIPGRFVIYADYVWDSEEEKKFDPCNKAADAWPIIIKNRIHIDPPLKDFLPWKADRGVAFECTHENPLRAAMIVFLKLKEHEC